MPTNLPWKLFIPLKFRPEIFSAQDYFHPTFLYESIWNVLVVFALLKIEKMKKIPTGFLLLAYFALYSIGRLWVEALRIDEATQWGGIRINIWIFGIVAVASITSLFFGRKFSLHQTQESLDGKVKVVTDEPNQN